MTTQTTKATITEMKRLSRDQKYDLEDLTVEFCDTWGFEFVRLDNYRCSYRAWIRMEEDQQQADQVDFVKCNDCGELVVMFQDDDATATCKCGNHFDGTEVDWS